MSVRPPAATPLQGSALQGIISLADSPRAALPVLTPPCAAKPTSSHPRSHRSATAANGAAMSERQPRPRLLVAKAPRQPNTGRSGRSSVPSAVPVVRTNASHSAGESGPAPPAPPALNTSTQSRGTSNDEVLLAQFFGTQRRDVDGPSSEGGNDNGSHRGESLRPSRQRGSGPGRALGNFGRSEASRQIICKYDEIQDACQHFQLSADLALLELTTAAGRDVVQQRHVFGMETADSGTGETASALRQVLDHLLDAGGQFNEKDFAPVGGEGDDLEGAASTQPNESGLLHDRISACLSGNLDPDLETAQGGTATAVPTPRSCGSPNVKTALSTSNATSGATAEGRQPRATAARTHPRGSLTSPRASRIVHFHERHPSRSPPSRSPRKLRSSAVAAAGNSRTSTEAASDTDSDDCAQQERFVWSQLLDAQAATQHIMQLTRVSEVPQVAKSKNRVQLLTTIFNAIRFLCKSMVVSLHNATDAYAAQQRRLETMQEAFHAASAGEMGHHTATSAAGSGVAHSSSFGATNVSTLPASASTASRSPAVAAVTAPSAPLSSSVPVVVEALVTVAWDQVTSIDVLCPAKDLNKAKSLFRTFVRQTAARCSGTVVRESETGTTHLISFAKVSEAMGWERCVQKFAMYLPWPQRLLECPAASEVTASLQQLRDHEAAKKEMTLMMGGNGTPRAQQQHTQQRRHGHDGDGGRLDAERETEAAATTLKTIERIFASYVQLANSEALREAQTVAATRSSDPSRVSSLRLSKKRSGSGSGGGLRSRGEGLRTATSNGSDYDLTLRADAGDSLDGEMAQTLTCRSGRVSADGGNAGDSTATPTDNDGGGEDVNHASDSDGDDANGALSIVDHATLLLMGSSATGESSAQNFVDVLELSASALTAPRGKQARVFTFRGPRIRSSIHFGSSVQDTARGRYSPNNFMATASCLCAIAPVGGTVLSKPALAALGGVGGGGSNGTAVAAVFGAKVRSEKLADLLEGGTTFACAMYPELCTLRDCGESIVSFADWCGAVPGRSAVLRHMLESTLDEDGGLGAWRTPLLSTDTCQSDTSCENVAEQGPQKQLGMTKRFAQVVSPNSGSSGCPLGGSVRANVVHVMRVDSDSAMAAHGGSPEGTSVSGKSGQQFHNAADRIRACRADFDTNWWLRGLPSFARYNEVSGFVGATVGVQKSCRGTQVEEALLQQSGGQPLSRLPSRRSFRSARSFVHSGNGAQPQAARTTSGSHETRPNLALAAPATSPPRAVVPAATSAMMTASRRRSRRASRRISILSSSGAGEHAGVGPASLSTQFARAADTVETGVQVCDDATSEMTGVTNWVLNATRLLCTWTEGGCDENDVLVELYRALRIPLQVDDDGDTLAPQWEPAAQKFEAIVASRKGVFFGEDAEVLRAGVAGNFIAIREIMDELKISRARRGSGAPLIGISTGGVATPQSDFSGQQSAIGSRKNSAAALLPRRARRSSVMRVALEGLEPGGTGRPHNAAARGSEGEMPHTKLGYTLDPDLATREGAGRPTALALPRGECATGDSSSPDRGIPAMSILETTSRTARASGVAQPMRPQFLSVPF